MKYKCVQCGTIDEFELDEVVVHSDEVLTEHDIELIAEGEHPDYGMLCDDCYDALAAYMAQGGQSQLLH